MGTHRGSAQLPQRALNVSRVEQRLADLGLALPEVAVPAGVYRPAILDGGLVWTSGQLPFESGQLRVTGRVGLGEGLIDPGTAAQLAEICALNALAAIRSVVADLDRVTRLIKVVGYVASDPGFTGQPVVIDGASTLLGNVFGDAGHHVRSAVGVSVLPMGAPVELELVAAVC